jgi:hypothetical protein
VPPVAIERRVFGGTDAALGLVAAGEAAGEAAAAGEATAGGDATAAGEAPGEAAAAGDAAGEASAFAAGEAAGAAGAGLAGAAVGDGCACWVQATNNTNGSSNSGVRQKRGSEPWTVLCIECSSAIDLFSVSWNSFGCLKASCKEWANAEYCLPAP